MKKLNRHVRRSFLAAVSRLFSVALAAGAGSMLFNMVGTSVFAWPIAVSIAIGSFLLLWFVEYEREIE